MLRIDGDKVAIETKTLKAEMTRGWLTFLSAKGGTSFVEPFAVETGSALELVYGDGGIAGFGSDKPATVSHHRVSDHCVEIRFHGWDADGVIRVSECPESGALLVEPSAYSSRPGVRSCRWWLRGIPRELELVAPLYQGIRMPLSDSLIHNTHWPWPNHWEAGLAILQGRGRGFWVHTQDTAYRYKGLQVGKADEANSLGFDTETNGYVDTCLGMGGLTWRINVYEGDWQTPAKIYRDWLWKAYDLAPRAASRPQWVRDLRFTLGWGHDDPAILDALASKVKPSRTLIHFSQWRTNAYDENYPDYTPTAAAKAFFAKGRAMGFHIMPHCNAIDMDPIHPAYHWIRDFEYRDLVSQGRLGWGYDKKILSVPNSNVSLQENRARKVMVKVHPGLSMWRSILCEEMGKGIEGLNLDAVFIDVTLNCFNIHNCLVENTTPAEGMKILIDEVAMLGGGVAVGGEGLNEITAQGLSLAQAHLFRHMIDNEEIERAGGCAVNAFLFDGLCRTVGYASLSGKTEKDRRCSRIHLSLGAIPTVNGVKADEIRNPNPYIQELIDMANAD